MSPYELEPSALIVGTPEEADHFLVSALWGPSEGMLPIGSVMHWARLLHDRGDDFASHAAACHYWLYEHYKGYKHDAPESSAAHAPSIHNTVLAPKNGEQTP
jgi:hypothetical protein